MINSNNLLKFTKSTHTVFSTHIKKLAAQQTYRKHQQKLGIAQRANKKQRVKAIHAKIANLRKELHHQQSLKLVNNYAAKNILALGHERLAEGIPLL